MSDRVPGYYWISFQTFDGRASNPPTVAYFTGNEWSVCGDECGINDHLYRITILSDRLPEPKVSDG